MPSLELFERQSDEYKESVLQSSKKESCSRSCQLLDGTNM